MIAENVAKLVAHEQDPCKLESLNLDVYVYLQLPPWRRMSGIESGLSFVMTVPVQVWMTTMKLMRKIAQVFILERC